MVDYDVSDNNTLINPCCFCTPILVQKSIGNEGGIRPYSLEVRVPDFLVIH